MSVDPIALAWIGTCLILVVSALASRRLGAGAWLRMAAAWLAIFVGVVALIRIGGHFIPLVDFT